MGHSVGDFKLGSRVRLITGFPGLPAGLHGAVENHSRDSEDPWPIGVRWDSASGVFPHRLDELELIDPDEPPSAPVEESKVSGIRKCEFEIHGWGIQELLAFIAPFQELGEENFSVSWTLKGTLAVPSNEGGA